MRAGIYTITRRDTGTQYLGSAIDIGRRLRKHRGDLDAGRHHSPRLQNEWKAHGPEVFDFSVVELVFDAATLLEREQAYLDWLDPGYNTARTAGSCLGVKRSVETRAKISAALKGNQNGRGVKMSPDRRAALSARLMGNTYSTGAKMQPSFSAALSARNAGNSYGSAQKGQRKSDAHRAACSAGQRRRWANARGEPV